MKKRILSIILALLLICSIFPMSALADDPIGGTEGSFTWSLDSDGVLTVNGTGKMDWLFSPPWEDYKHLITSAEIGEGVETIGDYAFCGCDGLESVSLPASLKSVGSSSFVGCEKFKKVYYAGDLKSWMEIQFDDNPFTTNNAFAAIGNELYINGELVTEIEIPEGIKNIGSKVFSGCGSLKKVIIPEGVESIGEYAFSDCISLESINIPASVSSIGDRAFFNTKSLTEITVADANTVYTGYDGCILTKDLTKVIAINIGRTDTYTIPDTIEGFDTYTLLWNSQISGLNISANYTEFEALLTGLLLSTRLETINVDENNPAFASIDGVLYSKDMTTLFKVPVAKTGALVIPEGVTEIMVYALNPARPFSDDDYLEDFNSHLSSLVLPDSLTEIPAYAFSGCTKLESITLGNNVQSIGELAFSVTALKSIVIPGTVETIPPLAFYSADALESVTISDGVTTIDEGAFYDCTALSSITIPTSVTTINDGAFYGCTALSDVYYGGTEAEWNNIDIIESEYGNECLTNATIHFTEPDVPDEPEEPEEPTSLLQRIVNLFRDFFARILEILNRF